MSPDQISAVAARAAERTASQLPLRFRAICTLPIPDHILGSILGSQVERANPNPHSHPGHPQFLKLLGLVTGISGWMVRVPTTFLTQVSQQVGHLRIAEDVPIGGHARTTIPYFRRDSFIIHSPSGH